MSILKVMFAKFIPEARGTYPDPNPSQFLFNLMNCRSQEGNYAHEKGDSFMLSICQHRF
jgi:hypothetical protein